MMMHRSWSPSTHGPRYKQQFRELVRTMLLINHRQRLVPPPVLLMILSFAAVGQRKRPSSIRRKYMMKILLLGDSGVGKSSIVERFTRDAFRPHVKATIGADFSRRTLKVGVEGDDPVDIILHVWDTAGMERFQSLGQAFYRGTNGVILVFDVSCRQSFEHLSDWQSGFLEHEGPVHTSFCVFGNKVDKEATRQVEEAEARDWCDTRGLPYFEGSAARPRDGSPIPEMFHDLAEEMLWVSVDQSEVFLDIKSPTLTPTNSDCRC